MKLRSKSKWRKYRPTVLCGIYVVFAGRVWRHSMSRGLLVLFAAAGLMVMLSAHEAAAQPPTYQPPAGCKGSTLNGERLMHLIQRLITHGDLTDTTFSERIFRTKYTVAYAKTPDGKLDTQHLIYQAHQVWGSPIHLSLAVDSRATQQKAVSARMTIADWPSSGPNSTFIETCIHITQADFSSYFGGKFASIFAPGGPPPTVASELDGTPGKKSSRLYLSFGFLVEDPNAPITTVYIDQRP